MQGIARATRQVGGRIANGPAAIACASMSWATIGLAKSFLAAGINPLSVAAARMVVGGVIFGAVTKLWQMRCSAVLKRHDLVLLAIAATSMCAYQGLFFLALDRAGVAVGTVVAMGAVPMFSGMLAMLTRQGRPDRKWCVSTALAIAGCSVLAWQSGPVDGVNSIGLLCALFAAGAYAVFTLTSSRVIADGMQSNLVMAMVFACSMIVMLPMLMMTSPSWVLSGSGSLVTLYVAVVATVGAYLLYGRGLRSTPVHVVSTMTLVEPAAAAVFGIVLLHESVSLPSLGGIALVCAAVGMLTGSPRRRPRQSADARVDYALDPAA